MPLSAFPISFGYEPDPILAKQQMVDLVQTLNRIRITTHEEKRPNEPSQVRLGPSDMQIELDRLIKLWMNSGPNLRKMFRKYPELAQRARTGRTVFYPLPSGRGYLEWVPIVNERAAPSPEDQALEYFMALITNSQWEMLGGPCQRCKDYFLKKTRRQRVYCSRTCGSRVTAGQAVNRHRQQQRAKKIVIAQRAIGKYSEHKRREAWKEWVSNQTGCTKRWITRAVNKGELRRPSNI